MDRTGEKRRIPAKCTGCGTIGIIHRWPDGTQTPLGQSTFCDCDDPELRVLEENLDPDGDRP